MHLLYHASLASLLALSSASQLVARNPYYGGLARPADMGTGCPANLEFCQYSAGCCPQGTWCSPDVIAAVCCPTQTDCQAQVAAMVTCADPSWTLYQAFNDFCCPPGEVGILNPQGNGQCVPANGITYSQQAYASTTSQANTASPPPPSKTTGASSSTKATGATTAGTAASTSNAASPAKDALRYIPAGLFGLVAAVM